MGERLCFNLIGTTSLSKFQNMGIEKAKRTLIIQNGRIAIWIPI